MIFARTRDGALLDAVLTKPFSQNRTSRNIVRTLAESDYAVIQYVEAELRSGEFRLSFTTYAGANNARAFFLTPSDYEFRGAQSAAAGEYTVQNGYIVLAGTGADPEMAVRFTVDGSDLTVSSDGPEWVLTVPYREVTNL